MTRVTRRMSLVEQELPTLPEHLSSPPIFSGVRVTRSLVLYVCFVWSLFVLLYFFFWPLCYLFFFDIRTLIAPLVSSNSSYQLSLYIVTTCLMLLYFNVSFIFWIFTVWLYIVNIFYISAAWSIFGLCCMEKRRNWGLLIVDICMVDIYPDNWQT